MPKIKDIRSYVTDVDALRDSYGTVAHYARKKQLNYDVLRVILYRKGRSKLVEQQLERDGFLVYEKASDVVDKESI